MNQKIQITIPEPCHEGWQNMTPVEKGRFCASCQKTVLDFTYLSDNEIINLVNKNDNLCGRFDASQLNRNLIETKRTSHYFGYFATSVLAFLGLGTESSVAQEKPVTEQTDLKYLNKATDSVERFKISGVVSDSIGIFLPGATIMIKESTMGTQADEKGEFSLKVIKGEILSFSFIGYKTLDKVVENNNFINVKLTISNEEIIIFGGTVGYIKRTTFFGRTFRRIGSWFR